MRKRAMMAPANPSMFRTSVTTADDGGLFAYVPLVELHRRVIAFVNSTGIEPLELVQSRFVNSPIPFYPAQWGPGERRWPAVEPAAMWHPLLWIPEAVTTRYSDSDGAVEDDDSWALRVAFEATNCGVYDPDTGKWLDLMASIGVDTATPSGVERIAAWLAGSGDAELDRLGWPDPPTRPDTADPDWAYLASRNVVEALKMSRVATDAEVLDHDLEILCHDLSTAESNEVGEIAEAIAALFAAAEASFAVIGDRELAWWSDRAQAIDGELQSVHSRSAAEAFTRGPLVTEAHARLERLAATYGERADQLAASFDDVAS